MEKKEITVGTATKSIVIAFIMYGIIFGCIFFFLSLLLTVCINSLNTTSYLALSSIVSFILAIILYFIVHMVSRLSTHDALKKYSIQAENIQEISKKLNVFFMICIIISIILAISILLLKFRASYIEIEMIQTQYQQVFSPHFTEQLTNKMIEDYNQNNTTFLLSTIIVELGFVVSMLSLVPFEKKMLLTYNHEKS